MAALYANRFRATVMDGCTKLEFGEQVGVEDQMHTAVLLVGADGKGLADLILRLTAEHQTKKQGE